MLSFELAGGVAAARRFAEAVDIITLADSLGGVETRGDEGLTRSSRAKCDSDPPRTYPRRTHLGAL
jgi:cystathionine beta-lyase/cystathionine gamma-synthase